MATSQDVTNRVPITIGLMLATVMNSLDTTIANVALPHMAGSVSASQDQITWVLTAYIVAAATMYDVSTQVIWSCEAERLPCMCGKATLAIVVSSAWMMVASITEMVIIGRFNEVPALMTMPRSS